ncbi:MAG: hypothetical protein IJ773_07540 [Lachnospiraceae bacterium]|nr:hypothetical protein [Lachnospiraceae bacterium]
MRKRNGKWFRNIAFSLILLLAMSLISACGKTREPAGEETKEAQVVQQGEDGSKAVEEAGSKAETRAEEEGASDSEKETAASGEETPVLYRLNIQNDAASVNTKYAVNAVHVYCPDTEEKEDYFPGDEVPAGTKICVFAYNTASEIHMTIVHNGETLCDKDFKRVIPWENDEKVERFEFTLEGELSVTTTAIEK